MRSSRARVIFTPVITVIALCGALAVAPALPASATPRHASMRTVHARLTAKTFERSLRSLIRRGSTAHTQATGPIGAFGPIQVYGTMRLRSHDVNYPEWYLAVFRSGDETYVAAATGHDTGYAFQEYEWIKEIPASDATIGSRLLTFAIHTGTDMGAFGAIDMTFTPKHAANHRFHCPQTGKLLGTDRRVQGSFSGTLSFFPGEPGLPAAIHATAPHAILDRLSATGARCPRGHFYGCRKGRTFVVRTPDGGVMYADPAYGLVEVDTEKEVDGFSIYGITAAFPEGGPGDNPITLRRADLTIDESATGDLLDGTVVFDRSGPNVIKSGRCRRVTVPFVWHSGSLDALFDTGTVSFTGADQTAYLHWYGENR
jgi:hypothetical protein